MPHWIRFVLKKLLRASIADSAMEGYEDAWETCVITQGKRAAFVWMFMEWQGLMKDRMGGHLRYGWNLWRHAGRSAWRRLSGGSTAMLVQMLGLSLGLAAFLVALVYTTQAQSFDNFHKNRREIVRIVYEQHLPDQVIHSAVSPAPAGAFLKDLRPEVKEYCRFSRLFGEVLLASGEKRFYESGGVYADVSFFTMFTFPFIEGSREKALEEPGSMVISQSLAHKYFGDKPALGSSLTLENGLIFKVTGVMADVPENSHLQFDFVIPFTIQSEWGFDLTVWSNWQNQYTYLLLTPDADQTALAEAINEDLAGRLEQPEHRLRLQPLSDIHLNPGIAYDGYAVVGDRTVIVMLLLTAVLVLAVAAVNVANLAAVRVMSRNRESGLRKVMGAARGQLILHLGGESLLLLFMASGFAVLWTILFQSHLSELVTVNAALALRQPLFWMSVLPALALLVLSAAVLPAWNFSRRTARSLLIDTRNVAWKGRRVSEMLVVLQMMASVLLMVFMLTMRQQNNLGRNLDAGFNRHQVVYSQMRGRIKGQFPALKEKLMQLPGVTSVTAGASFTSLYAKTTGDINWLGKDPSVSERLYTALVDFDYLKTFGLKIKAGRDFSIDRPGDVGSAFIVNEQAAELLGRESVLSTVLDMNGAQGPVIGVVEDFHYLPLNQVLGPLVMTIRQEWREFLFVRIDSENRHAVMTDIAEIWQAMAPEIPCELKVWSDTYAENFRSQRAMENYFQWLTVLAVILAGIGLLGMVSHTMRRARRALAVKKVLGASPVQLAAELIRLRLKQAMIAITVAVPLAFWAASQWLNGFAYRSEIELWMISLPALGILIIVITVVLAVAVRTVRQPPTEVLSENT